MKNTISYVMGARGDFLSEFLWNDDFSLQYKSNGYNYKKYHHMTAKRMDLEFNSKSNIHLFIDYNIDDNLPITFYMWEKTLFNSTWKDDFRQVYDKTNFLDKFIKAYFTMIDSWNENLELKKDKYTRIINFQDFYDIDKMKEHYYQITGNNITQDRINFLENTNLIQLDTFNKSINLHIVKVAHMVFKFETIYDLTEDQRNWSIVDLIKKNLYISDLIDELENKLVLLNYNLK